MASWKAAGARAQWSVDESAEFAARRQFKYVTMLSMDLPFLDHVRPAPPRGDVNHQLASANIGEGRAGAAAEPAVGKGVYPQIPRDVALQRGVAAFAERARQSCCFVKSENRRSLFKDDPLGIQDGMYHFFDATCDHAARTRIALALGVAPCPQACASRVYFNGWCFRLWRTLWQAFCRCCLRLHPGCHLKLAHIFHRTTARMYCCRRAAYASPTQCCRALCCTAMPAHCSN